MIDRPTPETKWYVTEYPEECSFAITDGNEILVTIIGGNTIGDQCDLASRIAKLPDLERERDELQDALEHAQMTIGSIVSPSDKATLELIKVTKERDEAREALKKCREDAKLITMEESLYAAKCIEVYATITPEGIEDLWPPEIQRIIHEMHEIGERLKGNSSQQNQ